MVILCWSNCAGILQIAAKLSCHSNKRRSIMDQTACTISYIRERNTIDEEALWGRKGFTLVELLIVVLIIGALAAIAVPRLGVSANSAKISACNTNVDTINRQIELYMANTGDWPNNFNKIGNDTDYFPDGPPECPFGNLYTIHGLTHRVQRHSH